LIYANGSRTHQTRPKAPMPTGWRSVYLQFGQLTTRWEAAACPPASDLESSPKYLSSNEFRHVVEGIGRAVELKSLLEGVETLQRDAFSPAEGSVQRKGRLNRSPVGIARASFSVWSGQGTLVKDKLILETGGDMPGERSGERRNAKGKGLEYRVARVCTFLWR
jgi:hypothetical protein